MTKATYGMRRSLAERRLAGHRTVQVLFSFLAVSVVVLALSALGLTQELAATLTGTVTDPSGAVVAGATVVVHSDDTGADVRSVTTSNAGNFNITNLAAGHYTVTVKNAGFQTYVAKDVILNVAEKHTLDLALKTGQASVSVEVTAEDTPIQTTTAEESGTVTGDQVRELALSNRNFEQLVLLQPGVSNQLGDKPGFGLSSNTQISINGARTGANNWTVDGADINDSGSNGTLLNTPGIDAIQEFTLERSNYDASFGRSGGGQIVVATKAGTNQFHGSAFEFNRNNYYNANTFGARANIAAGQTWDQNKTPIERYNDYGFTIGGPLFVPKLYHPDKDKTFFFWSEEWRKASTPGTNTISVPTAAELAGTFAAPITVLPPGSTNCVTTSGGNSTISPTCFSKNAKAYLAAFMAANPANANGQLVTNYSQLNNFRQDIIRLDQNVGDKVRLFARYMQDSVPQNFPYGLWGAANYPGVETTSLNAPGRNLVINASTTLSPTIVNEVEFVDSWGAINSVLTNAIADSAAFTSTLTNQTAYSDPYGRAPNISFGSGAAGLTNTSAPYFERNKDKNIFDNLSIQRGNHTIRTGLTAMWMTKTENGDAGAATFSFSNANGNPEFANFLLGEADTYTQQSKDTVPYLHYVNFEAYVQDDWKITPRLTLNLGVRYSYFPSPADSNNTLLNFDPNRFNPAQAPIIDPTNGQMGAGNDAATYANGLIFPTGSACSAAQAIGPLVTCSPYGSRVNPSSNNNWGPRLGLAYDPFGNGKWAIRAGYGLFYDRTLNGIWEQNAFNDPPLVQTTTVNNNGSAPVDLFDNTRALAAAGPPLGPSSLTVTGTPTFKAPSYQDFNLSVQHEIMRNTVLEVGYVGTKGSHLLGDVNINQPTEAARLANPTVDANALVPFPGYQAIVSRATIFTSNYNSLQVSLNRRFSQGLTLGVAYTWSKLLTTNPQDRSLGVADAYNLRGDYGLSTLNTPQILVVSYVYDLPFYKNEHNLAGNVLGGWEISGITNIQSGQSTTVTQGGNDPFANPTNNNSGLNMARGATAQLRTDLIGDPHGPKTAAEFFNTAAFIPAVGHFGTESPGTVLGPGFQLWDISLIKNVNFGERVGLQLRLETFNAFNHGNPNSIDTNIADSTLYGGNGAFGQVNGWHDPRTVQIGAKIHF